MDPDFNKFGRGPRELTGAVDLVSHYKLLPHYDFFCKKPLPVSISDSHYLHNVVGNTEIRKGERMQLGQLIQDTSSSRDTKTRIQPFDLDSLMEAFLLRDTTRIDLSSPDKGTPAIPGKSKNESKDNEKKHKKHRDKKHKHRPKDRSKDKEKEKERKKDKTAHHDSGNDHSKRNRENKRKQELDQENDIHKHKKSKVTKGQMHKSSKIDETGAVKAGG
ncbi:mediator of RNA polymerase II transcription subunit 19a-like isoform X1 [Primulina huaijiensis]|uniref:mediator of RNA polymerase II transcription subunit 19a-like isoform X1 n=1 Tax=Primulina huaijiensis TaxID=1492673 RepID=UPI003CC7387D